MTGNASAAARAPGCPANNAGHDGTGRGQPAPSAVRAAGHRGTGIRSDKALQYGRRCWWPIHGHTWVSPSVSFQALPAALSLPARGSAPQLGCSRLDPAPGWGRLLFTFKPVWWLLPGRGRAWGGDVVGWRLSGLLQGPGMRHSRALGWSCPGTPSGVQPARSGITQGAGDTLCHLRVGCRASSEVRARCTTPYAPVMTAAVAGGDWSHGSTLSRISPCSSSLARPCWLTEVIPGSFPRCDLEEGKKNTDPSLFSQLKLVLVQPLRGIVFERRASRVDWVVFICLVEMFSWLEQSPRCGPGQAGSRGCVARATVNIIVFLPCLECPGPRGVSQSMDPVLRQGFGELVGCL